MTMLNKLYNLAFILLAVAVSNAYALPDDQEQPIYITADTAQIDDKTGITTYKGNVIIKQGSLLIEGEHVDMYRGEEGVEKLIAKGSLAHFRQLPRKGDPYSDAWGKHLLYQVDDQKLTITEEAKVVQAEDTFTGNKIVYDLDKSIVNAFGGASKDETGEPGRVNMVIQPKKKTKAN
ncbi:lipopolysaccharide transport periplasmic protein LptA [Neptuniibacter sp. 1_MG-2023]|uniref:lipopolysaccharide transport periplasmic protein LptA n=1 Tax=Neptuniibacter sp. 1_MG-2023 TaxID=3062662 RepID=UPI0026E12605|nr:lipopolysaccharide transport periplasmic protein LptA [Neptuniibacter sp. 1_MG-2023]MDO6592712.1 lipopolysaccharide transport periplasmic protein LptA [Neptuniibacter sp. 1_MG-2023]